jgi:hypothetical protein
MRYESKCGIFRERGLEICKRKTTLFKLLNYYRPVVAKEPEETTFIDPITAK